YGHLPRSALRFSWAIFHSSLRDEEAAPAHRPAKRTCFVNENVHAIALALAAQSKPGRFSSPWARAQAHEKVIAVLFENQSSDPLIFSWTNACEERHFAAIFPVYGNRKK
ncbi:MAG TPA: hypothetical protein VMV39_01030, partial [Terracidiphilus sp.]|nr:hypothetical protein [Terracidiphilus sp.]